MLRNAEARELVDITNGAVASQTHSHTSGNFPASNAIDGDPDTFSHTDGRQRGAKLILTFPQEQEMARVEILPRVDCCGGRLNNARLVGFDARDEVVFDLIVVEQGAGILIPLELPANTSAQRLEVGFAPEENGIVHIAEMRVYNLEGEPPVIGSFEADGTTLRWATSGADEVRISGLGIVAASGEREVVVGKSTPFVLSAVNGCDTVQQSVAVEIGGEKLGLQINEFSAFPDDWVELWNAGNEVVALDDWSLTDNPAFPQRYQFTAGTSLQPGEFLVVDEPFGLSRDAGSFLGLFKNGQSQQEFRYPRQEERGTYGLTLGREETFFLTRTRGTYNFSDQTLGFLRGVDFSRKRGFQDGPFDLILTPRTADAAVFYALNGSNEWRPYNAPIPISKTTVVRAREEKAGFVTSRERATSYLYLADIVAQTHTPEGYPLRWLPEERGGALAEIPRASDYEMDPDVVDMAQWTGLDGEPFSVRDVFTKIPTLCVTLANDEVWDFEKGIHPNAGSRGRAWERLASLELIDPSTQETEHWHCGLRIHGGRSRVNEMLKKAFRLYFRGSYGDTKFDHPLFENMPRGGVDHLILRGGTGRTWASPWRSLTGGGNSLDQVTYMRDQFYRDMQQVAGDPGIAGGFTHLYINGQYWGLFNTVERPGSAWAANHLGGEKEDYDVLKWANNKAAQPIEGDLEAWENVMALVRADAGANYQEISGRVNLENLINYMLINFYTGNGDWVRNNSYAYRRRIDGGKFSFLAWDGEELFRELSDSSLRSGRALDTPLEIHTALKNESADYRLLFSDAVHRLFTDEAGAFQPAPARARWFKMARGIEQSVVGESARWGDLLRPDQPYVLEDHWKPAVRRVSELFLEQRPGIITSQLQSDGVISGVATPTLGEQSGGRVAVGSDVDVFYTTDGSDPRAADGSARGTEIPTNGDRGDGFDLETTWRVSDQGMGLSGDWTAVDYDDSGFRNGEAPMGYGALDGIELRSSINGISATGGPNLTFYLRKEFHVTDVTSVSRVQLNYLRDDGAAIYLNGVELLRSNLPEGDLAYDTLATATVGRQEESELIPFEIPPGALREGINVLAVEVHQARLTSSDLGFGASLQIEKGGIGGGGPLLSLPLMGDGLVQVRARDRQGRWSALERKSYRSQVPADVLTLTEIMYHPAVPSSVEIAAGFTDESAFEYLELKNASGAALLLDGLRFSRGVDAPLSGMLSAGEIGLVVKNRAAFLQRYAGVGPIVGEFQNDTGLSNRGEVLEIRGEDGGLVLRVTYADRGNYPTGADGSGRSLVLRGADRRPDGSVPFNWRVSEGPQGNPGSLDGRSFANSGQPSALEFVTKSPPQVSGQKTFSFRVDPRVEDVDLIVESSADLVNWQRETDALVLRHVSDEEVEVTLTPTGEELRYFRVRVLP